MAHEGHLNKGGAAGKMPGGKSPESMRRREVHSKAKKKSKKSMKGNYT